MDFKINKKIILPSCDVMDFLNIQDGGVMRIGFFSFFLSFNISETKDVIKHLTTDIIVTSMLLINKPNILLCIVLPPERCDFMALFLMLVERNSTHFNQCVKIED